MTNFSYSLHTLGLLLLCCAVAANKEALASAKYKDSKELLEVRIKDLMSHMTLEEKIGQMIQVQRTDDTAELIRKFFIGTVMDLQKVVKTSTRILIYINIICAGSVLSGGESVPAPNASPEAWVNMVNEIQKVALSTRLEIPVIYGIDAVHGHNYAYNATIFPHNIGLGATRQVLTGREYHSKNMDPIDIVSLLYSSIRDPSLVKRIGEATALEVRATGIQYVFAPCIAVSKV